MFLKIPTGIRLWVPIRNLSAIHVESLEVSSWGNPRRNYCKDHIRKSWRNKNSWRNRRRFMETFPRGITKETSREILNRTFREIPEGTPGDNAEVTCWGGIRKRAPRGMSEGSHVKWMDRMKMDKSTRVEFLEQIPRKNFLAKSA